MKCFKDHDSDYLELNAPTLPVPECETYFIEENGKQVKVVKVPILTGEGLWRIFQREAEEIVAPGGVLIADPRERNRAINAAYARLWQHDGRTIGFSDDSFANLANYDEAAARFHESLYRIPKSDARLRFIDDQYGFVTPLARYFSVSFGRDKSVSNLNIMPQIEPLLLDDALKLALNLQDQWRNSGWSHFAPKTFQCSPIHHNGVRNCVIKGKNLLQAGLKHRAKLPLHQLKNYKQPTDERYRVDIGLTTWREEP